MILIPLSLAILVCGLELGRGGTFDSKRVLYVHARDGLEDKLEPDDIGACLALPVSTLRKATLTAISDILKKLGEVMDTSAEKGQERFLLFAALELTSAGVRLLDATYLRCCERLGCETCGLSESAESEESSLTLLESFGRKAAALCHLVESSIALTTSTLEIRQREPPVIKRRGATQQVRHALQELLTADISVGLEALPPDDEAFMNVGGVVGQTVRLIILQLLDAIPDMASEVRHLPKGVPAWSQLAAAEVLEASGASSATVQEMLFLLPLPAGWPATRASPLCEKHLLESSGRGRDQAQIAFARRDAAATTTWLGASPSQLLKIIATSGRPVHRSYVAIRQAGRFGQEASCEEAVGILYDPTLCLDDELGLSGVIYFLTMDPEIDDPLYVKWIGRAWSGQRSKEQPVWQSTMDPIMPPPDPYDLISLNPMAGNCQTIWQILQADSISTASIVYVPVNPTIPPPLEVMPNFTHFYIWHRRKSKAARRVGMDRFISNLQAFRRYMAAQCSLESVSKLLGPLGYELLYLEHFVAVLVHQRVASLVRQHLGQPGTTPSTFEVWRQGWYCSPYSRYMDHLEVGVGFDATWLSPEPSGPSERGLGCSRSFKEFLAAEGHLISGSYTGKDVCDEELQSTSRSMAMQAMHRRLRLLRGTATAGTGVASAEAMDTQPRAHASWCQHQLQSACACLPPFRGSDCYIVDQGARDKERPFRGALVYVLDRRSETLEACLANLRRLNVLAGWEYPLIIFTAGVLPEQEKEKIILASENRVWFLKSQDAHIAGSGMLQWFRHTHLFDHPGIAGLDILWDLTDGDIAFKEDPLRSLHTKTAQAACRHIEDVSPHTGLRTSQDAFLGDLTELFLQLSQASLAAEGVHGDMSACVVWKRAFMSEPLFRQYIQFLEDAVGGAAEAALRFDALSVRNFGTEMLHRQVRGSQLLMLG